MQLSRRGAKFRRFQAKTGTAVPTLQCYALAETFEGGSTKRPHIPSNVRSWPILLKKSEYRLDANFSASHVRFFETDVGDRIVCIRVNVAASKSIYGGN
jgi:hypothetical protein